MKSTANASEISTCVNSGGYILVKLNRQRDNLRSKHYDYVWSGWIPLDPYVSTGTLKVVEGYNLYLKHDINSSQGVTCKNKIVLHDQLS